MRTNTIKNRDWNRNSYNVKKWCFDYQDRDTGELIKVKGDTEGRHEGHVLFGNRNHPSLMGRRLRFLGIGTVNVSGLESAMTVPAFSYAQVDV